MTTSDVTETLTSWERFRSGLHAAMLAGEDDHVARVGWDRARVREAQHQGLRRLVAHAVAHSPFHRERLNGVEVDRLDPGALTALPVMTKAEMMQAFDDVVTDRRLTLALVEEALARTGDEPVPILGDYVALASGGSSGVRGVFVLDRDAMSTFLLSLTRTLLARLRATGGPPPGGLHIAMVAAASAVHATGAAAAIADGQGLPLRVSAVPATLPLGDIVERLHALRPQALFGYPTVLVRLAAERRAGRLRIEPMAVTSTSETLTAEARSLISDAFGVPVVDTFGSTEGLAGSSAPGDDVLVFNSDTCVVELVDDGGRPVPAGTPAARVLVTNLANLVQPLIRYELNDVFVQAPDSSDHGHLRARVEGRSDEPMRYGDVAVHPLALRSVLLAVPAVIDYQVRQTERGAVVDVVAPSLAGVRSLEASLARAMAAAGLADPEVSVRVVEALERHDQTGKLRRFVPLEG